MTNDQKYAMLKVSQTQLNFKEEREMKSSTPIYARDLKASMQKDTWLGKGFEALLEKAVEQEKDVLVGYFLDKPYIEE